jgi:mediator of RNA polymerase II transcription subunit 12
MDSSDLSNDWRKLSFLLSPWKRGATAVLSQFVLRQLGKQLSQEATCVSASACLDELTTTIFHHSMAPEEARFVAEMVRSVDSAIVNKVMADFTASMII